MKKNAFTLAEVLITLVIIGVIAAMTIPTLMGNLNDQKERTRMKKAVSMVTQAFSLEYSLYGNKATDAPKPSDADNPNGLDPRVYQRVRMLQNHLSIIAGKDEEAFCTADGICFDVSFAAINNIMFIRIGDPDIPNKNLVSMSPKNRIYTYWMPNEQHPFSIVPTGMDGTELLYN